MSVNQKTPVKSFAASGPRRPKGAEEEACEPADEQAVEQAREVRRLCHKRCPWYKARIFYFFYNLYNAISENLYVLLKKQFILYTTAIPHLPSLIIKKYKL